MGDQAGESETLLGDLLATDRDHFVVATKFSSGAADPHVNTTGNGRKNMLPSARPRWASRTA
jgi:aryl-alcohol dehydrogenase-like predicted oxidoreductase